MKASLTLDQPGTRVKTNSTAGTATALHDLIKPTRSAAAGQGRASPRGPAKAAPVTHVSPTDLLSTSEKLRRRLGTVVPQLFDRTSSRSETKLLEILIKRIGALVADATARVRARFGAAAAALAPDERACLQDALLLSRPAAEDLLHEAIDCFTPGELFALLATGCLVHAPEQIDALRCHDIICGGRQLFAREAVLDLLADGPDVALMRRLDTLLERHLATRATAVSADAGALLERLAGPNAKAFDGNSAHRSREEMTASDGERLMHVLRRGNSDAAIEMIAKAAGVLHANIQTAIFLRTAKGLVSLAWRGGFDPHAAVAIQVVLGHVAPDEIIHPAADGGFALGDAEMLWQCRFVAQTMPVSVHNRRWASERRPPV